LSLTFRIVTSGVFPSSGPPGGPATSTPYIGTIYLDALGPGFTPSGTQVCDGTILPIGSFAALFSLIGNQFGGSAINLTFAVPDLRDFVPLGHSGTWPIGSTGP
jgi:microcystin-dependent protein